mgnify:CR=1 FL=1
MPDCYLKYAAVFFAAVTVLSIWAAARSRKAISAGREDGTGIVNSLFYGASAGSFGAFVAIMFCLTLINHH